MNILSRSQAPRSLQCAQESGTAWDPISCDTYNKVGMVAGRDN